MEYLPITSRDYTGTLLHLVDKTTNKLIERGIVKDFRGNERKVSGGIAPHKPGSEGFVRLDGIDKYAGVINAKWVHI